MATHSILVWRIPRTEEPGGCRLWGHTESDTTDSAAADDDDNYSPNYSLLQVPVGAGKKIDINIYQVLPSHKLSFLVNSAQFSEHKYLRIYRTKPSLIAIPLILLPSDFLSIVLFLKLNFCHFNVLGHCGWWCHLVTIISFIPNFSILHYGWNMFAYLTVFGLDHVTLVSGTWMDGIYTIFNQKL